MVKRAKQRRGKVRKRRQRMQQTGIMLQMDGSPHPWFGGKPSWGILNFDKSYHPNTINEACQCAMELGTVTYGAVKRLLKLQRNHYKQKITRRQ